MISRLPEKQRHLLSVLSPVWVVVIVLSCRMLLLDVWRNMCSNVWFWINKKGMLKKVRFVLFLVRQDFFLSRFCMATIQHNVNAVKEQIFATLIWTFIIIFCKDCCFTHTHTHAPLKTVTSNLWHSREPLPSPASSLHKPATTKMTPRRRQCKRVCAITRGLNHTQISSKFHEFSPEKRGNLSWFEGVVVEIRTNLGPPTWQTRVTFAAGVSALFLLVGKNEIFLEFSRIFSSRCQTYETLMNVGVCWGWGRGESDCGNGWNCFRWVFGTLMNVSFLMADVWVNFASV